MIEDAAKYGRVWVALNSDEWLYRKKGYFFMTWEERAMVLKAMRAVSQVVRVDDADGTVCEAIHRIHPDFFANGGDRVSSNDAENIACFDNNVQQIFSIGGNKVQSSSQLVQTLWQRLNK